ncbi:MAG: hypothetical protein AB7W28_09265 [Armatimonadota bacterium]
MSVYLPTTAVGNGRVLVTIGASGELMSLYWPHIDFANNVHEAMPALYLGNPREGTFYWTWEPIFERHQYYLGETNIVVTQLKLPSAGLELLITDFCPGGEQGGLGEPALVRRVRIENRGPGTVHGLFMHYFDLRLGETPWKQAVRYAEESKCVIQYFRDIAVALGGTNPDLWRCGKWSREDTNAKNDMYDGYLEGQAEDIGQCNFALAWRLALAPNGSRDIDLIIACDSSRERAVQRLGKLRDVGRPELQRRTHSGDAAWLAQARPVAVPSWLASAYRRGLLALKLLTDHESCAVIAAPEFDPTYELCGGYGYCWPRDAAEAVFALADAGYEHCVLGLAKWLADTQLGGGVWGQRYWTSGDVAASWSLRRDFLQLDQSASAVLVLCRALEALAKDKNCLSTAGLEKRLWAALRAGTEGLLAHLDDDGYHHVACDLWETYAGVFAYTQASIVAALREARSCAAAQGASDLVSAIDPHLTAARSALISFYIDGYFVRGRVHDRLDPTVDSSTLGLVHPFDLLDLSNLRERAMAVSNLETIEHRLGYDLPEGRGIKRYEGDGYMGGAVGTVNTLWAGLVCYRLALTAVDRREVDRWRQKGESYVKVALAHATPTGLLPELVPVVGPHPYWAAPHAWALGLVIECALAADELGRRHP